jgi:4-amino-4-deoxy-L-arabinose transferase-like glycosyltransferase
MRTFAQIRRRYWQIAAVLALSLLTGLFNLTNTTLWSDEAFSYYVADDGLRATLYNIFTDTQPPLYYLLLSLFLKVGDSVFFIRVLSVIAFVGTCGLIYVLAARLFSPRIGTVAGLLAAIDPRMVDWAQKARPYSVQTFFVALALWGLVRVMTLDAAASQRIGSGLLAQRRVRDREALRADLGWTAYAVGSAAAMLTQHPGALFVLAANAVAVCHFATAPRARSRAVSNWFIAQAVVLGLWLLWLPGAWVQLSDVFSAQASGGGTRTGAFFSPSTRAVASFLAERLTVSWIWNARYVAIPVYVIACVLGIWQLRNRGIAAALVLVPIALPIGIALVGFEFIYPVFGYLLAIMRWINVPYLVLIAVAIVSPGNFRAWRFALAAAIVGINLWALKNYYQGTHPPIDELAKIIATHFKPGDGIIFPRNTLIFAVGYYVRPFNVTIAGLDITRDGTHRIHTLAEADEHPRNWVALSEGDLLPVDLSQYAPPAFEQRWDKLVLLRFDHQPQSH